MHILVVEDNPDILANLYGFLEPLGYTIDSARTGMSGLVQAAENTYDAIVLDVMLPGIDGVEVCRKLRKSLRLPTPVLMLTARDTIQDKVVGFEAGADDYLVKPFSLVELDIRLRALGRRASGQQLENKLRLGDVALDPATYEVARAGKPLHLTPTGFKLLAALMRVAPHVLTRDELEREIWGDDRPDSDALRTHIHSLRQALDRPFEIQMLKTIPGVGYRLIDPNAT